MPWHDLARHVTSTQIGEVGRKARKGSVGKLTRTYIKRQAKGSSRGSNVLKKSDVERHPGV